MMFPLSMNSSDYLMVLSIIYILRNHSRRLQSLQDLSCRQVLSNVKTDKGNSAIS